MNSANTKEYLFSNRDLKLLIAPLIAEQFLIMALGIVDTIMVAFIGEAAISSISLVNILSNMILQLLAALCTGGAVVVAQYLGRNDIANSCKAATQLMISSIGLMIICTALFVTFRVQILNFAFGSVSADVMENAQIYWLITTFSFPFLAAYNSSVAIFRSMGNSKTALNISILMNIIHLFGNALLIYYFKWGVAGAAVSTLISRIIASLISVWLLRNPDLPVFITGYLKIRLDMSILRNILKVGIPSGIENTLFNLGKILVQSLIAGLGTAALAANAVINSIGSIVIIAGSATSLVMITVIGRCIGASQYEQAEYYVKKIMKITFVCMTVSNIPLILMGSYISHIFNLGAEASLIMTQLLPLLLLANTLLWPPAFTFPNALRAAGDVRFSLIVSFISMWFIRVGLSYVFVKAFNLGLSGVWYSMYLDWTVRGICFYIRYKRGKWKTMNIIS